jgi:hypothetical protein
MKIAVDRKALEINRRITDVNLHHPPILVQWDDGKITWHNHFPLAINEQWNVVYEPDPEKVWIEVDQSGEPVAFNVWIENV